MKSAVNARHSSVLLALILVVNTWNHAKTEPRVPATSHEVLLSVSPKEASQLAEFLKIASNPSTTELLIKASGYITHARETGNPRFLGYASAITEKVLRKYPATTDAYVLQALVDQSLHHFNAAIKNLESALQLDPNHAQALLTKASILQVTGKAETSKSACSRLYTISSPLVFTTCLSIAGGLTGSLETSTRLLENVLNRQESETDSVKAWAWGSLGEMRVRLGEYERGEDAFKRSLALGPYDSFVRSAYVDMLFSSGKLKEVLNIIDKETSNEALLLRRILALKTLASNSVELKNAIIQLQNQFDQEAQRGSVLHLREQALAELLVFNNTKKGLELAKINFNNQKEPIDLYIFALAAKVNRNTSALKRVLMYQEKSRLEDALLTRLMGTTSELLPQEFSYGLSLQDIN
jgi:hypothetical protein